MAAAQSGRDWIWQSPPQSYQCTSVEHEWDRNLAVLSYWGFLFFYQLMLIALINILIKKFMVDLWQTAFAITVYMYFLIRSMIICASISFSCMGVCIPHSLLFHLPMPAGVVMNTHLNPRGSQLWRPKWENQLKHPFCSATSASYPSAKKGYMLQVNCERKNTNFMVIRLDRCPAINYFPKQVTVNGQTRRSVSCRLPQFQTAQNKYPDALQ